jgi:ABC-type branched-subunit amino acid transport system substrate-binding protein
MMIQESFRLWAKQVNQRGGILGRKVKMVLYDDKSQPSLVKHYYQKLIEEDNVDLVFSPYGTPLTLAASEISERHKYIMLACAAAGKSIWQKGYHYVFGMYAPADRMFIGLLDMMAGKGHKTLSLIYDATSSFNLDVVAGAQQWADKFKNDTMTAFDINGQQVKTHTHYFPFWDWHIVSFVFEKDFRSPIYASYKIIYLKHIRGIFSRAGDIADRIQPVCQ